MKQFKKILCAYDFSDYAEEALLYALKMSDPDTVVTLLNIIQVPYIIDPNGFTYFEVKSEEIKTTTEEALQLKIAEIKNKFSDIQCDFLLEIGNDPSDLILKIQHDGDFDLIVMGSHGRKGFGRLLMGSVSESVMREATCPVMIIKSK